MGGQFLGKNDIFAHFFYPQWCKNPEMFKIFKNAFLYIPKFTPKVHMVQIWGYFDNPNSRKVMRKFFEIFAFLAKIGTFPIILAN